MRELPAAGRREGASFERCDSGAGVGGQGGRLADGAQGTLSRRVSQKLGALSIRAWLLVADVTVVAVGNGQVTVRIDKERSKVTVNRRKVDHFKRGETIKLAPR